MGKILVVSTSVQNSLGLSRSFHDLLWILCIFFLLGVTDRWGGMCTVCPAVS